MRVVSEWYGDVVYPRCVTARANATVLDIAPLQGMLAQRDWCGEVTTLGAGPLSDLVSVYGERQEVVVGL